MNKAYLLTGGNMGNREKNLATAKKLITERAGKVTRASALYETAAWGKTDQPSFYNQALEVETSILPKDLLKLLLEIEMKLGRQRDEKYGPRTIDIDILLYGDQICNDPQLRIPHPELQNRRFALTPLAEIGPGLVHPVFKKSITELLAICTDTLEVIRK
jgi:2-amino-4-hydroxy-6-hydroxymethyldihydropteridine diphosphokinase